MITSCKSRYCRIHMTTKVRADLSSESISDSWAGVLVHQPVEPGSLTARHGMSGVRMLRLVTRLV